MPAPQALQSALPTLVALALAAGLVAFLLWLARDTPQKRARRRASLDQHRRWKQEYQDWLAGRSQNPYIRAHQQREAEDIIRRGTRGW